MSEVPFLPDAEAEFLRAVHRYEVIVPGLGADFIAEIESAIQRITSFPQQGNPYLAGTRRVVLKRFPFSVVYLNEPDDVLAVAVAHQRQRPGYWLDRVPARPE